jgi:asparagine synthase (glutamine-hydrolysing)
MVGTYGSEMLLHAVMFKPVEPAAGLFRPELLPQIRAARETYDASRRTHPVSFVAFRQTPWHHYGVLMLEQTQVAVRSPYLDNDLVKTIYRAPGSVAANEDARMRLIRDGNPALAMLRTDRGIGGRSKVGAAISRAHLEFTFKAEYAYDYGMPQWVAQADHLLAPFHLERLWMGRHKIFHFRLWYKTVLAKYVKEILLDPRTLARPYLERSGVEAVVNGHLKGNRNFTIEIHRLLSLELLHRVFVDAR